MWPLLGKMVRVRARSQSLRLDFMIQREGECAFLAKTSGIWTCATYDELSVISRASQCSLRGQSGPICALGVEAQPTMRLKKRFVWLVSQRSLRVILSAGKSGQVVASCLEANASDWVLRELF